MQTRLVRGLGDPRKHSMGDVTQRVFAGSGLALLAIAALFYIMAALVTDTWLPDIERLAKLVADIWENADSGDITQWLLFTLSVPVMVVASFAQHAMLVIDEDGIHYSTRLPEMFKGFYPDWSLHRDEIRSISLFVNEASSQAAAGAVDIHAQSRKRRIQLFRWSVEQGEQALEEESPRFLQLQGKHDIRRRMMKTPVVKALQAAGYDIADSGPPKPDPLKGSPMAVALVAMFVIVVAYGVIDMALLSEEFIGGVPYGVFFASGALGGLCAWLLLATSTLHLKYRVGVAVMLALAIGVVSHPGLRRINTLYYPGETLWMQVEGAEFVAEDGRRFPLPYPVWDAFWASEEGREKYLLTVRKGAFDTTQLDVMPLRNAMREYYRNR